MTVRKIEGLERFEAYKLDVFCFHQRVELGEPDAQKCNEDTTEDWGAFADDGTLMARIVNNHYDFYIDGTPAKTGGIGGVGTLPEYRESGAVRAIFEKLLPEAYRRGEVISALYPFSHAFYRKFGYEVVPFGNEYKLTPGLLSDYRKPLSASEKCEVRKWKPGESVRPFLDVYNAFAPAFNLAATRTEDAMKAHMNVKQEYIDRKFSYLFLLAGKPAAYLIFTDVFNPAAAHLKVEECAWTCRAGFYAVLNFLSRFSSDYGSISLTLPSGMDMLSLITSPDAYSIEKRPCQNFMVRVVNAKRLLEIIRKPETCDFTIGIEDELIAENNVALRVTNDCVEELNNATAEQANARTCDIELNIRTLSQLATGGISLDEALLRPDVTVHGNEEQLRKCFTRKAIFVTEAF